MHADVIWVIIIGAAILIGLAIFGKLVIKSVKWVLYGVIIAAVAVYAIARSL